MADALPDTGTLVALNGGMPGTQPGQTAILHRQAPGGADQTAQGLVWLETLVRWSHGTTNGFWATAGEYEVLTTCPRCSRPLEYVVERAMCEPDPTAIETHHCPKETA